MNFNIPNIRQGIVDDKPPDSIWYRFFEQVMNLSRSNELQSYTVATLPSAETPRLIFVSDEIGGPVPAYSDGTNWRRVSDGAVVS